MNKAIFLDRDGVINEDYDYVHITARFYFKQGIFRLVKAVMAKDFLIIFITNQAGIGRGLYDKRTFPELSDRMKE